MEGKVSTMAAEGTLPVSTPTMGMADIMAMAGMAERVAATVGMGRAMVVGVMAVAGMAAGVMEEVAGVGAEGVVEGEDIAGKQRRDLRAVRFSAVS